MMSSLPDISQKRVFMWGVPRCLSTAFLRAIANVEDFLVWYEPYLMVQKAQVTTLPDHMINVDPSIVPDHFYSMLDECNTYSWVKQQLERDFKGKRLVFVKEMVEGIHGHYEDLPKGYRHTFMIRHPLKVFASLKTMYRSLNWPARGDDDLDKIPETVVPPGYFFKEMLEFVDHMKKLHEPKPLIIDADDLQSNPDAVVRAFCTEVGIPFDQRIVNWEGDVSFNNWVAPKELASMFKNPGVHKKSSSGSTGFSKLTDLPLRSDLPEDVLRVADASMESYETLYAQRLIV